MEYDFLDEVANTNSHLTNTYENEINVNVCIDWLTFMVPYTEHNFYNILLLLKLDYDSYEQTAGNYNNMFSYLRRYGDVVIKIPESYTNPTYRDTYFEVDLSGQACRSFEDRKGSWMALLTEIVESNGHATRIDTPIDDFSGNIIPISEVVRKLSEKEYVATFQNLTVNGNLTDILNGNYGNFTLYLGRRGSDRSMCIYNKIGERIHAGMDVYATYWIRYEMRFAHEKANKLLTMIVDNGMDYFTELVTSSVLCFLDFRNPTIDGIPTNDSNKSRWDVWENWREFLQATSKIKLKVQNDVESSITKKKIWFDKSISGMITQFYLSSDSYEEFVHHLHLSMFKFLKEHRLDNVKFGVVINDRKKKGLKDLSYEDFINKLDVLSSKVKGTLNFDLVDKNYYKHKLYKLPIYETATELNRKEETLGYYAEAFGDILEVVE